MNEWQKRVLRSVYKEDCYILMSPKLRNSDEPKSIDNMDYYVSFLYHNRENGMAAEWEPKYGPIQVWDECKDGNEGAREHYFFDWTNSGPGNWSQMAVERYGLHGYFYASDWDSIFNILKGWTER